MINQAGQRKDTIIGRAKSGFNRSLSIFIRKTKCCSGSTAQILKLTLMGLFCNTFGQKGVGSGQSL